jgi:predicted phosphoserine aminotransferase
MVARDPEPEYAQKRLYLPGPTEVPEEVLDAMSQPMFGHRTPRMTELYTTIVEDTKRFLDTSHDVIILSCSGTEFWEATTLNMVDERMAVATCGSFSERQADVAERLGTDVDRLQYEWGEAVKPADVREFLETSEADYDVFATVMNETSTGVRNPVEEIGDVLESFPETLFVVDAISCLGGDRIDIDAHGIDAIFTSTQKAFAMPPGLAVCAVSEAAYERERANPSASWYGGFQRCIDYYDRTGQTHSTPAIPLMLAYRTQMKRMLSESHPTRDRRHQAMAAYTQDWARRHFGLFAEPGYESQTVTCIENTIDMDVSAVIDGVSEAYDFAFSDGYGSRLGGETFRIGHMGEHTVETITELTEAIEDVANL